MQTITDDDTEAYEQFAARYHWARHQHDNYYSAACVLSGRLRYMDKRAKAANMRADLLEAKIRFASSKEHELQSKMWPGFVVQCDLCKGFNVHLENSMGFSAMSGSWGSIDFVCSDCNNSAEIVEV